MEEKQKRIKKTSNEQYQFMINFMGDHKLMMKGKLSPAESTKVGELWMQLTKELNNMKGSIKPLQQWKRTFIEYKSKVKAKSRILQNKLKGTGGGPAVAQLSDTENLCLNLIGRITTEGDPEISEIGLTDEGSSKSSDCELITVVVGDADQSNNLEFIEEEAPAELIDNDMANPGTSSMQMSKDESAIKYLHTPTSRKSGYTRTPTQKTTTLKELADTNERIVESLSLMSGASNGLAQSNNAISSANNTLAISISSLADAIKLFAEKYQ